MSTIAPGQGVLTFINVFTVEPDRQPPLVDLLIEAVQKSLRYLSGFVSANIHRSLDDHKVINYAQWRSKPYFEAMRANPEVSRHIQDAAAFAPFASFLCEVFSAIELA